MLRVRCGVLFTPPVDCVGIAISSNLNPKKHETKTCTQIKTNAFLAIRE